MTRRSARTTARFGTVAAVAGIGVAIVGIVVGALLAEHVRYTCGGGVYQLINLYCTHQTHPYRLLGLIVIVVSAALGVAVAVVGVVQARRTRT